jgi:hypothetical protein
MMMMMMMMMMNFLDPFSSSISPFPSPCPHESWSSVGVQGGRGWVGWGNEREVMVFTCLRYDVFPVTNALPSSPLDIAHDIQYKKLLSEIQCTNVTSHFMLVSPLQCRVIFSSFSEQFLQT